MWKIGLNRKKSGLFVREEKMNFINLTNGIQAIHDYVLTDYTFIRIQSTWCEQKRFEDIIFTLSDDFLMNIALGNHCIVYDYGANKEIPRAIWQGLEWIKYVLYMRWYKINYTPTGRACLSRDYFEQQYRSLSTKIRSKLDYFRKYKMGEIKISSITSCSKNDGNIDYHMNILKNREIVNFL
jgi:hypothetical protein